MRLVPTLAWTLEGDAVETLDDRLLPLLDAIANGDSLANAVASCGLAYRTAWGLLRDYERKLGVSLVLLERGRGASLTRAGEALLGARRLATRRLARALSALATEIGPEPRGTSAASVAQLRVAASHDLALAALAETLPLSSGLSVELSFMGSLNAIREFVERRADVAGFHVPLARRNGRELDVFLERMRNTRDRVIRFADREQGLILPRDNPAHVRTLRDVAAKSLRFVNRQRGSGTRLLIDRMLAQGGIGAADINGYATEEFTHAAVAATVASGGADVGVGLRAAAAEYGLAFVPLVRERYFLAVRANELATPAVSRLIEALRSPAFVRLVRSFAGYQATDAGAILRLAALRARSARSN